MSVDLTVQKAIRARLVATAAVTDLVPAAAILDRNERPAPSPSIVLGETQVVDEGTSFERSHSRVFHTLHVWKRDANLIAVKAICGEIRTAIHAGRLALDAGYHTADCFVATIRALRDPDGETSHGVVMVEVLVAEVTS
ncbi:MAG: hypothetical protein CML03_08830 [Pseudooceanicola sp.]|nr:hypothetical protein [Pseudooceanicola sp.]|tara:strand:+ start:522 stop:938 length:417 start_codon:yes stop_codon:yes gene_type:complete